MSNTIRCFLFLSFLSLTTSLCAQSWRPTSAVVSFKIKMLGSMVEGSFGKFQGKLQFDPAAPQAASIMGSVETQTIETGNSLRNKHLREKESFFEAAKYPKISIASKKIEKVGQNYAGVFDITIKNVTKSVRIPFNVNIINNEATFESNFTINRKDWALGGSTIGMANEVQLLIKIHCQKKE